MMLLSTTDHENDHCEPGFANAALHLYNMHLRAWPS